MTPGRVNGAKEARRGAARRHTGLRALRGIDRGLAASFALLMLTGVATLYAASYYNAQDSGSAFSEVASQLLGMAVGAGGMAVILKIDYRTLARPWLCGALLAGSFAMLALVAVPGIGKLLNGSRRWLRLGPVSFQPSELGKYAMILYLARALSQRRRDVTRFFTGLVPLFILPGLMFMLILLQPNLSTAGSVLIVTAVMAMLSGARWRHMGLVGAAGMALGTFYALSEDYRRARLMSFRHPFDFMTNEGYQLSQSLLAFGSGGLFGMGMGMGRQKFAFLPYPESDFIFAVVGEDLGFVGCVAVLALFGVFLFFGLRVAMRCEDRFGSLLAGGITCMIGVQCVLNVAVVIGMMPTTGLPLPFFSAGGTSISILMCAVAVVMNISRANQTGGAGTIEGNERG
ncbi:MAG: putative lipid II flippase FtsW [Clostridia bacterium]|nr:putative lipid II flippase FtsW [Clostridia bacterium]